jgi:hypothetical protein
LIVKGFKSLDFFSNTAYSFLGFVKESETLYAVLKQSFISADAQVDTVFYTVTPDESGS